MRTLLAFLAACGLAFAESYHTYADHTVWIERENELGYMDTVSIEHVVSITRYDDGRIRIRVAKGFGFDSIIKYPKSTIIKESGE